MPWFQVDDGLPLHPKVVAAGNAPLGLWVRAGAWSMRELTEGFIPDAIVRILGTASQAAKLVEVGLWIKVEGGYQFHEWGTRQMSAAEIEDRRRKRAEAGRKGGQRRSPGKAKQEANTQASASANAEAEPKQNGTPVPVPVPVLSVVTKEGNGTSVDANEFENEPPPETCSKHRNDPDPPPCGRCADHRRRRAAWDEQHLANQANLRTAFWTHVANCPDCDENGFVEAGGNTLAKCPNHDWELINA